MVLFIKTFSKQKRSILLSPSYSPSHTSQFKTSSFILCKVGFRFTSVFSRQCVCTCICVFSHIALSYARFDRSFVDFTLKFLMACVVTAAATWTTQFNATNQPICSEFKTNTKTIFLHAKLLKKKKLKQKKYVIVCVAVHVYCIRKNGNTKYRKPELKELSLFLFIHLCLRLFFCVCVIEARLLLSFWLSTECYRYSVYPSNDRLRTSSFLYNRPFAASFSEEYFLKRDKADRLIV